MRHTLTTLSNGLPVLRIGMPGVSSVTMLILANAGSRYELPAKEGIAHFFEHIVFKGTTKYPEAQILASTVDSIGGEFNAFTSREYTGYYVKCASRHGLTALDVLSDMLLQPKLRTEDIEREKGVIIEEINMYQDNPMHRIANEFEQMVWAGSGLSHDIAGSKNTVSSVTRDDFVSFLSEWYGLGNLLLVVSGDDSFVFGDQLTSAIEAAFSKSSEFERQSDKQEPAELKTEGFIGSDRLKVVEKPTEQAHLVLGWPGLKRSDDRRYALSLLSVMLGGNMSSRLFSEVREKRGLCYYVHSDADYYHETGFVGAAAGVDPKRVDEAIKVIIDEFRQVGSGAKPFTEEELTRAKEYIAGTMTLSFEDSRSVAQFYGTKQLLLDRVETLDEVLALIRAVSLDQVQSLAVSLFTETPVRLGVIGPFKADQFASLVE